LTVRVLHVLGGTEFGGAIWVVQSYVEALMEHGCAVTICATADRVTDLFRRVGCEIVEIPEMVRAIDPRRDAIAVAKLARVIRRRRFDVVHTHTSKGGIVGRAAARLAGVPIVLHTAHGFAFHERSSRRSMAVYVTLERLAARWSDRIITVSEFHRQWALDLGIGSPDKVVTIHNGISRARLAVSPSRTDVRQDLGLAEDDLVIASIGRLAAGKGLEDLVAALPEVLRAQPRARLLLAGDGPLRQELEAQVRAADLEGSVRLPGFRQDVGDLLMAADLVAAPSLREGLSISVLEAMAMGRPIVATTIGSNRELIDDGVSGLLVPPDDAPSLTAALVSLLGDPDRAARFGSAARARFEAGFTERTMKEAVWALYAGLLWERGLETTPRRAPA
jgi:glycosyltransferase involved in cell wall biosynthesis